MKEKGILLYKRILGEIEKKIQIHPNYVDLHNQLALLYMMEGDRERAEKNLVEALRLNPKYREAILNLGYLYTELKRWKEAEDIFVSESKKHPQDGFLHHVLSILYFQNGKRKEAGLRIRKAIQCDPYYRDYYKKMGVSQKGIVYLDQKTERVLKKVLLNYHHANFHSFIGIYLAKEGKPIQALRELKKAEKLEPNKSLFHANLGTIYYHQGSYQKAIQEYQKALRIDSHYGMGYANLSYIYGLKGKTREALRYMKKAVRLNPRYADFRYSLALLYSDRKRYKEAISELKKALRINPKYLFPRINLGVLYEEQERWREARREYRKILQITPGDEHIRRRLEGIS